MKRGRYQNRPLAFLGRIPRPVRVLGNLAAIALVVFLWYVFEGAPALNLETAFRRAEKAELVGPSEILDVIPVSLGSYNRLLIAEDAEAVILYTHLVSQNTVSSMSGRLVYQEKTGEVTVVPAPAHGLMLSEETAQLPVVVVTSLPQAVRAQLDLELKESDWEESPGSVHISLTAEREEAGYFLFTVSPTGQLPTDREVSLINELGQTSLKEYAGIGVAFPATVRLYGADGQLLHTQSLVIRSRAGDYAEGQAAQSEESGAGT